MAFDLIEIGRRVRAYRLGAGYTADQLASKLQVSRAALYRIEQGDIVKIDVIQNIATILGTSLASLLGVGAEYHSSAASYQSRMQQLEENATHIVALFSPLSYLLTTPQYDQHLVQMIEESIPPGGKMKGSLKAEQQAVLNALRERRMQAQKAKPSITCLISLEEVRRLATLGLVGRLGLPPAVVAKRKLAAKAEVQHIADLMRTEPVGIQIGLVENVIPNVAFQLFYRGNDVVLGSSPFRVGELPNLHVGVAMITSSPEAVNLHIQLFDHLWSGCKRGAEGAKLLEQLLTSA
ncbi:MAG: helix-turn-helix transcriptional regulator [Polaromonas sp.]|uniref:helix-turn-helix domain-containing protein n=1 Tax=Polaromonas sp. TaxID=1869339 RepID=UPI002487D41D|nr:helix-turn-helix transcriptional regulator [Polaromonas sp.]MDI1269217.1 helix-turn-helix transcriptional regulator [Polaromonas sp.]